MKTISSFSILSGTASHVLEGKGPDEAPDTQAQDEYNYEGDDQDYPRHLRDGEEEYAADAYAYGGEGCEQPAQFAGAGDVHRATLSPEVYEALSSQTSDGLKTQRALTCMFFLPRTSLRRSNSGPSVMRPSASTLRE